MLWEGKTAAHYAIRCRGQQQGGETLFACKFIHLIKFALTVKRAPMFASATNHWATLRKWPLPQDKLGTRRGMRGFRKGWAPATLQAGMGPVDAARRASTTARVPPRALVKEAFMAYLAESRSASGRWQGLREQKTDTGKPGAATEACLEQQLVPDVPAKGEVPCQPRATEAAPHQHPAGKG